MARPTPAPAGLIHERSNSASVQMISEKGRQDRGPGAKGLGSDAAFARRFEGGSTMVRRAIAKRGTYVVPPTYVVPVNEHEAALEFATVVIPFSRGELARAGKRGKDAAKRWKEGQCLPSAWAMMHLARQIPEVRNWMAGKMGMNSHEFMSPEALTMAIAGLYQMSFQKDEVGKAVREMLAKQAGQSRK